MGEPAKKKATYEDICNLPETVVGEIVDGEMFATPRPSTLHSNAAFALSSELGPPYRFGRGNGPGGWMILFEPEILLGENILVPDLAGWKRERLPTPPTENWVDTSPDWICEILSPGTMRLDKVLKMPIYAEYAVPFLWLVDPLAKTLDIFKMESGKLFLLTSHTEDDKARLEPFQEIEIDLKNLWWV